MFELESRQIELTHSDKILFPADKITKFDLVKYYQQIADVALPFLRDRPLMMHRFPSGIQESGFFQKQIGDYFPDWINRCEVSKEGGSTTHAVCNDAATLVYLVNQGCISPHVWLSRVDRLDNPDQMIFDLDPPENNSDVDSFQAVRFAAKKLKQLLNELQLPSYVKTTGSRGLHVVVPLDRSATFDQVRSFARNVAAVLAQREPHHLTVEQRKQKREGRLYLDTGRNAYAQTAVAPYAVRPLNGAPVATPLDWEEVNQSSLHAQSYTIANIFRRLGQKTDPWADMFSQAVDLQLARQRLNEL